MFLGIYCRTSREQSVSGIETIEQQIQAGVKFAKDNNFDYQIYKDEGVSGYKITDDEEDPFDKRPEFARLLKDIKENKITDVWVWEKSRLSRNNYTQAIIYREFEKNKITLWENNRKFSFDNATDRLTMTILDAVAEFERFEIVARTSRGQRAAFDKGNCRHGSFYGYRNDNKKCIPISEELEIVKQIYFLYLERNETLRNIANKFFTDGTPETKKLLSVVKKVRQILCHEEYTGQSLKMSGRQIEADFDSGKIADLEELRKDEHWVNSNFYKEKIIDRETWIQAREKIEFTRRRLAKSDYKKTRETETSLATGILRCEICNCNFYYKNLRTHGGIVYKHLQTVEKCKQTPFSFVIRKIDTIIDVFYSFYYLLFDNTEEQLNHMKITVNEKNEKLNRIIKEKTSERSKKEKLIEKLQDQIINNDNKDLSVLVEMISNATQEIKTLNESIRTMQFELAENKQKENDLKVNEKYQIETIDRIKKWFKLRKENNYKELRIMLRDILFDGFISIEGNTLVIPAGDPCRLFYFDIENDYNVIIPFIEKLIDQKIERSYSVVEEKWLESKNKELENFNSKVKDFLLIRPERLAEENFTDKDFLFLTDCFNVDYYGEGIGLFTSKEENLISKNVFTTEKAAEILGVNLSTLRWWAKRNSIPKTLYNDGHWRFYWTEKELELYRNSPHEHKGCKGYKFTPEQLEHLSKVRKGRKQSEETKRKRAETMKKIWAEMTPEERERRKSGLDPYNKKR